MSRRLHFIGTSISLALLLAAVNLRSWKLVVLALVQGYAAGVDWALLLRTQPARDIPLSAVELHGRLAHVVGYPSRTNKALARSHGQMRLIGMLDSPFVRRVAVCLLEHLRIPFDHEPVSVFTDFEQFRRINPVVKAPTLIGDDGTV